MATRFAVATANLQLPLHVNCYLICVLRSVSRLRTQWKLRRVGIFYIFFFVLFFIYPLQPGTFCNLNRLCAQTQQRSHLKSGPAEEQVLYRVFFVWIALAWLGFILIFPLYRSESGNCVLSVLEQRERWGKAVQSAKQIPA